MLRPVSPTSPGSAAPSTGRTASSKIRSIASALAIITAVASSPKALGADPPPAASVVEVKLLEKLDECLLNTKQFDKSTYWFLRRGSLTSCDVVVSPEYKASTHTLKIIATHTFDGAPNHTAIVLGSSLPNEGWGAVERQVPYVQAGNLVVPIIIQIPGSASVGEYTFTASVEPNGQPNQAATKAFPKPAVILFNPWSAKDKDVYWDNGTALKEYVLETAGRVYDTMPADSTEERRSAAWRFGQFEPIAVEITLKQLEGLTAQDRSSALKVCRHLVDRVAAKQNDGSGGILIGRWDGNYGDGKRPGYWSSSTDVLNTYKSTGAPVKYGQCWVFAGTLATMSRCLGIPSQTTSGFNIGNELGKHDPKEIDEVIRRIDGKARTSDPESDSFWDYHVWTEVRVRHEADTPTWQACDSTRDTFPGLGPVGPAPMSRIKGKQGGNFDVDLFSTHLDGDYRTWFAVGNLAKTELNKRFIGWYITQKKVGSQGWVDITGFYKVPEKGTPPASPLAEADGLQIEILHEGTVQPGESISFTVSLRNDGNEPRQIDLSRVVEYRAYNGEYGGDLFGQAEVLSVAPGETKVLPWELPGSGTFAFAASMETVTFTVAVADLEEIDPETESPLLLHLGKYRTIILPATPVLTLGSMGPFPIGGQTTCTLSLVNPLDEPANDVLMILSASHGTLLGGSSHLEIPVGVVRPNATVSVQVPVEFLKSGTSDITATVLANEFRSDIVGVQVEVLAPPDPCPADLNGDGRVNGADLGLLLAAWGTECACECISPDLNGDGVVDGGDMGAMLSAWGPCPN